MTQSAWQGELHLDYASRDGQTQLIRSRQRAPLKVQRPFYPEGQEICHTVLLHTAGGVVGGDRLAIHLNVQSGAQVFCTTAAASKLYRSNGQAAQQNVTIQVAQDGCLEWFPQAAIAFCGAKYRANMRVNLAAGAQFVGWEITRFGRTARGEYFTAGDWRSRLEIWQDDDLLWSDRQWLPGIESVLKSPHGLAGNTIVGTLVWCGLPIDSHEVTALRNYGMPTTGEGGLSRLQGAGLICRYRGLSMATARDWLMTLWQHLRRTKLHRQAVNVRVWT